MIAEIISSIYDATGKPVGRPVTRKRKLLFSGTFPPGRYISQPLSKQWSSIEELRRFLSTCKYVSDLKQFGKRDYWLPPEQFEEKRKGDCEDFSLYTWRQLLGMGYKVRYVIGQAGKYGAVHAWVTIEKEGKHFIVEPLAWYAGNRLPRLSVVRYEPERSVEWDGQHFGFFIHKKPESGIPFLEFVLLVGDWLLFWAWFWLRFLYRVALFPFVKLKRVLKRRVRESATTT